MADLDLDDIERRLDVALLHDGSQPECAECRSSRAIRALLAEVRRLRAATVYAPVVGIATDGPRPTEGGDAA